MMASLPEGRGHRVFLGLSLPWLMLVIYGSLAPLKFYGPWPPGFADLAGQVDWLLGVLTSPRWWDAATLDHYNILKNSDSSSDVAVNLLLYFPLGFLWRLDLIEQAASRWRQVLQPTMICLLICWTMECVQSLMEPIRTASLNDVLFNVLGALMGAALAPAMLERIRRAVFWSYCRLTVPTDQVRRQLRPWRLFFGVGLLLVGLGLIVVGYFLAVRYGQSAVGTRYGGVRWLPLVQAIDQPYARGIESLLVPMAFYGLLGGWIWSQGRCWQISLRPWSLLLILPALALGMELARRLVAQQRADMTQPTLAFLVAVALVGVAWLWHQLVRRSCRRRRSQPVAVDRRRRAHAYF